METAAVPKASPRGGSYTKAQSVTLTSATSGAKIYITFDGSTPTKDSLEYSGPFVVDWSETIKAIAVKDGMNDSAVMTERYILPSSERAETPIASPWQGNYERAQSVTLSSATEGAAIYYTTNGTPPTTSSTKYAAPIDIKTTTTLKAIAAKDGMANSEVLTALYTITGPGQVAKPVASPVAGNYTTAQSVKLTSATKDAIIYYTTDSSTPTTVSSKKYTAPISISTTTTLKAIAVKDGMTNSEVFTAEYTITFGGQTIEEISAYLSYQRGGTTTANPVLLKVNMYLGDLSQPGGNWRKLLAVLADAGKYIILDISDCTTGTSFNHYNGSTTTNKGMDKIVDIVFPDRITSIGRTAFYNCKNLALTKLPDGITSIESSAFYGCTNLALTSLPDGITSIGGYAFEGCTKLALTSLPSGITSIGGGAFRDCTNLEQISLPNGITSIGASAFENCTKLALTSLPSELTFIGMYAFRNCTSLSTISIDQKTPPTAGWAIFPSSVTAIYVPADSVAAYKAADVWSIYADMGIIYGY